VEIISADDLGKNVRATVCYDFAERFDFEEDKLVARRVCSEAGGGPHTILEVVEGDCIEAAIRMKEKEGLRPAVLNMASNKRPGGGYLHGAGAQEGMILLPFTFFSLPPPTPNKLK